MRDLESTSSSVRPVGNLYDLRPVVIQDCHERLQWQKLREKANKLVITMIRSEALSATPASTFFSIDIIVSYSLVSLSTDIYS